MYVNTVYFHDHDAFSPGLVQLRTVRLFFTSKTWSKVPGGAITILKNMSSSMGRIIPYMNIYEYIYIYDGKETNVWNILKPPTSLGFAYLWYSKHLCTRVLAWFEKACCGYNMIHWGYQLLHLIPGLASNLRRSNLRRSIVSGLVQLCLRGKEGSQNELKRVKLQAGKLLHITTYIISSWQAATHVQIQIQFWLYRCLASRFIHLLR